MQPSAQSSTHPQRGSALVIALLVTVILTLLGISFLLMTETENRIAVNEQRSAQAFFVAQSTARVVKRWFDAPNGGLAVPLLADVDRSQRLILDESDPYDPADVTTADGVLGSAPYYKQGVDLDANGRDDLFDRPYRTELLHPFLGTEQGPDIVIDDSNAAAATFLRNLEQTMLPDFPGEGLLLRIARIDLFAPPYVRSGASWSRYGVATVRVVARIVEAHSGRVVAEREVRAVISEIPYWGAYGALHSCGDLVLSGAPMSVHWGAVTAGQSMQLPATLTDLSAGLPRSLPAAVRSDPLLSPLDWDDWTAEVAGQTVADPWLRFMAGGELVAPPVPSGPQPYSSPWIGWTSGDPAPGPCCDVYSHLFAEQPFAGCPSYDYDDWKSIGGSPSRGAHYFSWDSAASAFREDGTGTAGSVQSLTHGREGIFFFDTIDRQRPRDDDGDGSFENLTPAVTVAGSWNFRGVLYLNAVSFAFNGTTGASIDIEAPGEPFDDANQDGRFDAGERHVNLTYAGTTATAFNAVPILASGTRETRGPAISLPVSFQGLLITRGAFEATGVGTLYGSVVANAVTQSVADGSLPTPRLIFDAALTDGFPPVSWDLPRVTVTGWVTERK